MSKVTAKLNLKLEANDVVIAESNDTELCLKVLNAISKKEQFINPGNSEQESLSECSEDFISSGEKNLINEMAKKIGVTKEELMGACDPKTETPYIELEHKCWESLKNTTGARGRNAVSPIVLALTLLCIWFDIVKLGKPTQKIAQQSVKTLGISDKNPTRSIKNCDWLQQKQDKTVIINPAKYSLALSLSKKYVTQSNE